MPLDVTSPESIAAAAELSKQLTDGKLDFLINNAGCGYFSPLLDVDIEKAKKQYDVNVWGMLAVTQAFFPLVRAARGTVVNQASMSGVQGFNRPFLGIYSSSKSAVISISNTMRIELAPFDIKVVTLITTSVKTEFFNHKTGGFILNDSVYAPIKEKADKIMQSSDYAKSGPDRYEIAQDTIDELMRDATPIFIRKGYMATLVALIFWLFPQWMLDRQSSKSGNLDRLKQSSANEDIKSRKLE
ncbi:hypothetical protein BT93_L0691 [Corymbia citriodora subsp. variegata]|uniref:Uncharacterized protein n=1 Tax=Corymbia citriodora subsp. variegata TaxID=360336 RepID=A0A8T0CEN5_CORYI|nr:hypothetical protein BT93_L0691 [Corymbia citriodora subsp. variegata]